MMSALNAFDPTPQDDAILKRRNRDEQRKFLRSYNQVSVTRMDDGRFEVHPLRHERGGYVSIDREKRILDSTAGEDKLHSAIMHAVSKAE